MKKLYRLQKKGKILGICAGLGDYFEIDPTILRLLLIYVMILTGFFPVFIAYLIASVVIPLAPKKYIESQYKKLYRIKKDAKLAGVLASFARYFKIDPTLVRIIFIVVMFITAIFPMIICYLIAWAIIPEKGHIEIEINKID